MIKLTQERCIYHFLNKYTMGETKFITAKEIAKEYGKKPSNCGEVLNKLTNKGYLLKERLKHSNELGYKLNIDKIVADIREANPYIIEEEVRNALKDSRLNVDIASKVMTATKKDYQEFLKSFGYNVAMRELPSLRKDVNEIKEKLKDMDLILKKLEAKSSKK